MPKINNDILFKNPFSPTADSSDIRLTVTVIGKREGIITLEQRNTPFFVHSTQISGFFINNAVSVTNPPIIPSFNNLFFT